MHRQPSSNTWDRSRSGQRFFIGLLSSLSLVLVAFEWRTSPRPMERPFAELSLEDSYEYPKVFIIQPRSQELAQRKRRSGGTIVPGDPSDDAPSDDPTTEPGSTTGTVTNDSVPFRDLNPPEPLDPGPMPWMGVEQRPYFKDCLTRSRNDLDGCTEARIDNHLKNNFIVPDGMRGEEFTVVTFEIAANGKVGRVLCAPKPSADVMKEVERVVRSMPEFMPATQNGRAVAVVYQIPFRVARR